MMKALLIGGTGQISMAITRKLVRDGWEVFLLNRGSRTSEIPKEVHCLTGDITDEAAMKTLLDGMTFDCVCEFIVYMVPDVERDYRLFMGKTSQFLYISSASAYHKPVRHYLINEGTTLANPYWQYSRDKIACEEFLMEKYREDGFPVTIVRPSHTYDERHIPLGVHGTKGFWQVIKRMQEGKPVIIQGDGTSLWTMTFNEDFAVGFTGLMGNRHAIGEAFQITSDETLTWNQIYETIADALGVELNAYHVASEFLAAVGEKFDYTGSLIGDKSNSVVFDNRKIKAIVPQMTTFTPFHEGVRIALDYVLSHKELQVEDQEFDAWCDRVISAQEDAKTAVYSSFSSSATA